MKYPRTAGAIVAFVLGAAAGAALVAVSYEVDRSLASLVAIDPRVNQVLANQAEAWNCGDLERFMGGYWNDPNLTFRSGGTVTKGYGATLARYRQRYQTGGTEMGKLSFDDVAVKLLGDTALVTGRWTLDRTADTPTGLFTLRMELTPDGWKIVDDHTSAVEPTPQKPKVPEKK